MNKELKIDLFNIYDLIVFEDENGITQDTVCSVGSYKELDDNYDVINCNNHSISIYDNGDYKVWEKDGKDLPEYSTNKKITHLYSLKNDNRFYEVYPTDEYSVVENVSLNEALGLLKKTCEIFIDSIEDLLGSAIVERQINESLDTIQYALIKAQGLEKENAELLQALSIFKKKLEDTDDIKVATMMLRNIDTIRTLEKEIDELKKFKQLYQAEIESNDNKETNEFYDNLKENAIKAKAFDEIKDIVDMVFVYDDYEIINDKISQIITKALERINND